MGLNGWISSGDQAAAVPLPIPPRLAGLLRDVWVPSATRLASKASCNVLSSANRPTKVIKHYISKDTR